MPPACAHLCIGQGPAAIPQEYEKATCMQSQVRRICCRCCEKGCGCCLGCWLPQQSNGALHCQACELCSCYPRTTASWLLCKVCVAQGAVLHLFEVCRSDALPSLIVMLAAACLLVQGMTFLNNSSTSHTPTTANIICMPCSLFYLYA